MDASDHSGETGDIRDGVRMVTMDDVRIVRGKIIAAPYWAFEPSPVTRGRYVPITEAWGDVWAEMHERASAEEDEREAFRERMFRLASDQDASQGDREYARTWISFRKMASRHAPQGRRPAASLSIPSIRAIKVCESCGCDFFGLGSTSTCTDRCAKARKDAVRTRGEPKHVERTPKDCERCGARFNPPRSDARYCSTRCRVAAHRENARA